MNADNFARVLLDLNDFLARLSSSRERSTRNYMAAVASKISRATIQEVENVEQDIVDANVIPDKPRDPFTKENAHISSFIGKFIDQIPEEIDVEFKPKKVKSATSMLPALVLPIIGLLTLPRLLNIFEDHPDPPKPPGPPNTRRDQKTNTNQLQNRVNIPWEVVLGIGVSAAAIDQARFLRQQKLIEKLRTTHVRPLVKPHVRPPVSTSVSSGIGGNTTNITTKVDASKLKPKPQPEKPFSGKRTPEQNRKHQQKVKRMKLNRSARGSARFLPLLILPWLLGKQEVQAANEMHQRDFYKGIINPGVITEYNRYLAEEHDWENHPVLSTKRILAGLHRDLGEDATEETRQKYFEHKLQILVGEYMGTWHAERVERETIEAEKQHFRDIQQKDPGDDQVLQNIKAFTKPIVSLIHGPRGSLPLDWADPQVESLHSILTEQMDITSEDWGEIDIDTRGILLQDAQYREDNPGTRTPMEREALDFYNEKGGTGGWRKKEILEESKKKQQDQDIIDNKIGLVSPPGDQLDSLNFRFDIDNNAEDLKERSLASADFLETNHILSSSQSSSDTSIAVRSDSMFSVIDTIDSSSIVTDDAYTATNRWVISENA